MSNDGRNSSSTFRPEQGGSGRNDEYMMALSTVDRQGVDWAELLGGDGSGQLDVIARSLKNTDMQFI